MIFDHKEEGKTLLVLQRHTMVYREHPVLTGVSLNTEPLILHKFDSPSNLHLIIIFLSPSRSMYLLRRLWFISGLMFCHVTC